MLFIQRNLRLRWFFYVSFKVSIFSKKVNVCHKDCKTIKIVQMHLIENNIKSLCIRFFSNNSVITNQITEKRLWISDCASVVVKSKNKNNNNNFNSVQNCIEYLLQHQWKAQWLKLKYLKRKPRWSSGQPINKCTALSLRCCKSIYLEQFCASSQLSRDFGNSEVFLRHMPLGCLSWGCSEVFY